MPSTYGLPLSVTFVRPDQAAALFVTIHSFAYCRICKKVVIFLSYHFIIKNAAVRRSMRRCLIAQSRSMSKTPRPPSCAYPSSGLIAVRPPYKNTLRSQKSVPLHSTLKKSYAARNIMYIRPMVISFLKANAMSNFL